jgi:hypothetical protein
LSIADNIILANVNPKSAQDRFPPYLDRIFDYSEGRLCEDHMFEEKMYCLVYKTMQNIEYNKKTPN